MNLNNIEDVGLYAVGIGYLISALVIAFVKTARPLFRFTPIYAIVATVISGFLPTPDSWSDVRSQWVPIVVNVPILIVIGIVGFLATCRGRLLMERISGISGLLLFGVFMPLNAKELYASALLFDAFRHAPH